MTSTVAMRIVATAAVLALAGCSGGFGSSNPFGSVGSLGSLNPFGGGSDGGTSDAARPRVEDETVLIEAIESVAPEAALRGTILRATVIAATEGYHTAQFVARNEGLPNEAGIVTFDLRAIPPEFPQPAGPLTARRIVVATFVSDADLESIRGFRIVSRTNTVDLAR